MNEEFRVFDFNDIVAAVGGLLGLFLDFSGWSCSKFILEMLGSGKEAFIQP